VQDVQYAVFAGAKNGAGWAKKALLCVSRRLFSSLNYTPRALISAFLTSTVMVQLV
jgi:hypothetical protein